jgi:hypothetical protein
LSTIGRQEMGGRERGRQSAGYTEAQSKADRQSAGIQQQVNRQQSGKTSRQACRQVDGWRVAGRQHVSRHTGQQEARRPA